MLRILLRDFMLGRLSPAPRKTSI